MEEKFDFENLVAWQKAVEFTNLILEKTDTFYKSNSNFRLREQLDACSSSIPLNIAEGKGRFTKKNLSSFYIIPGALLTRLLLYCIYYKKGVCLVWKIMFF
ncbi:MAG: four helix bundle protein [Saprospiraceae bacterium]|nr:four helix bundle protein [Saprospiraceae bacterium]